jgi:hypothetical protein
VILAEFAALRMGPDAVPAKLKFYEPWPVFASENEAEFASWLRNDRAAAPPSAPETRAVAAESAGPAARRARLHARIAGAGWSPGADAGVRS